MARSRERECPAYERCAKITGSNSRGEGYTIRDCYRTISFDAKLGENQTWHLKILQGS